MKKYTIYTDGAYSPTDEKGGIGFVILDENEEIIYMDSKQYIRNRLTIFHTEIQIHI